MIPKDLFEKVRRIEITTSRLVSDVFAGQYHSVFKGQGIEFNEVREYQPGDDVRSIDWNVTARTGRVHVKKFIEERELTVMILIDASRSCRFASVNRLKSRLAAELASLLAFAAIRNNDKVGLIIFTDEIEKFIPPKKGTRHVLRIIRETLYFEPKGHSTDVPRALQYLNRVSPRKTITFLVSDFIEQESRQEILKKALAIANRKHDLIPVTLNDPRECFLPDCGIIALEDAETGEEFFIDSSNAAVRDQYEQVNRARLKRRERLFRSIGVDAIDVSTQAPSTKDRPGASLTPGKETMLGREPYADAVVRFFRKRQKRL